MYPIECTPRDLYCAEWAAKRIVIESARKMLWVANTRTQSTDSRNRFTRKISLCCCCRQYCRCCYLLPKLFEWKGMCTYATSIRWRKKSTTRMRDEKKCSNHQPLHSECYGLHCAVCEAHVHWQTLDPNTRIQKMWARFFLLQFIYSSLHGEMNRDRCRWHRWQPATKEETM